MSKKSISGDSNVAGMTTTGPRWESGKLLARSILGDPEDFEALSREQTRVMKGADSPATPGTPSTAGFDSYLAINNQPNRDFMMPDGEMELPDREAEIRQALETLKESRKKESEEKKKKLNGLHIFQVFLDPKLYCAVLVRTAYL